MSIAEFQKRLTACGYPNIVSSPDPEQEFSTGTFGTILYREDGPELEIRLPDTETRRDRVKSLSVASVEEMPDEMAVQYIATLADGISW